MRPVSSLNKKKENEKMSDNELQGLLLEKHFAGHLVRHLGYAVIFDKWRHRSRPYRDLSPKINMSPRSLGAYLPADKISDRIYASAYLWLTLGE